MMEKDLQKTENTATTERIRNVKTFVPRVDIYETKDSLFLTADMPGVDERTVDVHIRKIRVKLGDLADLIETKTGVGYKFRDD